MWSGDALGHLGLSCFHILPQLHTRAQSLLTADWPTGRSAVSVQAQPGSAGLAPTETHPGGIQGRREGALEPREPCRPSTCTSPVTEATKTSPIISTRVPLSHAAGQRDLEQAVALQHLLDPEEDGPQLPLAQHLGSISHSGFSYC